jgi:hypothetical protein
MSGKDKERGILRRYLLGELPEPERSQLADRYFVDEELFDELLDVENELLGQYVRKQLLPAESKHFSDYLGQLPDGASKLATAYALMEAANELREVHASSAAATHLLFVAVPSVAPSRWQVLRHRLLADHYVLRYATVVVLIALIAGLFYLSLNQWRRDTEQLRAKTPQPEQNPTRLPVETAQQDRRPDPERDTRPDERVAQTKEPEPRQERPLTKRRSESGNMTMASLILTLPMRSGGTPDVLTLSPETQTVSLVIPVPQEERIVNYSAVLQTTSGRVILSNVRLRPRPSNSRTVSLRLSASQLASETHKLTLLGKASDGIEVAYDYYFKIVRKQ